MKAKVGPLIAQDGSRREIVEMYEKMRGRHFVVSVNNDKGGLEEPMGYGGDDWTYIFRVTDPGIDVPDYSLSPSEAAEEWWKIVAPKIEDIPASVWIHAGNELDKNRADWLGEWGISISLAEEALGRRVCLFNFAAGEPEPYHWLDLGMQSFLRYAANNRDRVAVGLHEYSYEIEDVPATGDDPMTPAILRGFPWMVGRFTKLFERCDRIGIERPTVLITEFGWKHDEIPDHNQAIRDIALANAVYDAHPQVLGAGLWYSGGGKPWDGICYEVEKLFPAWGDYMASLEEIEPEPEPDTIDLADFIFGIEGVQHVLQCRFGDHFQGTQTLCTLRLGPNIYAQQKDSEQEIIYHDNHHIYRETDTSPGQHEGRPSFYCLFEEGKRGSNWGYRHVKVDDVFERCPLVTRMYFDDCGVIVSNQVGSSLRVVAVYDSYIFDDGYHFNYPVVELAWEVGGIIIERYFYGKGRGLVRWVSESFGWKSYLVEEHFDRPPMPAPAWPDCFPRPSVDLLYYRDAPEVEPPPEPDPCEYHRIFHLLDESIDPGSLVATSIWANAIQMRSTCGYSWHDACVSNPCLISRTVHTWEMPPERRKELVDFQDANFPGAIKYVHHPVDFNEENDPFER